MPRQGPNSLSNFNVCSSCERASAPSRPHFARDGRENRARDQKILAPLSQKTYFPFCPISHVPVVVCRSVGIRTRGRTAAKETRKPSTPLKRCATQGSSLLATVIGSRRRTGAPRAQRGTRLKATTERAFLVSASPPPAGANTEEACPSLPGVRMGSPLQSTAAQLVRV